MYVLSLCLASATDLVCASRRRLFLDKGSASPAQRGFPITKPLFILYKGSHFAQCFNLHAQFELTLRARNQRKGHNATRVAFAISSPAMPNTSSSSLRRYKVSSRFLRFVVVGGIATVLHYGIYYVLLPFIPTGAAYTAGYVLSFLVNFYLTARFTFQQAPTWRRFWGMCGAHGANYLVHMALLAAYLYIGVPEKIAPIPIYAVAVPINYTLLRFVFKKKAAAQA